MRFDDELSRRIVIALAQDYVFWQDFEDYGYECYNLPSNFDELDSYERAKIIYDQSDNRDDKWIEYLGLDYGQDLAPHY